MKGGDLMVFLMLMMMMSKLEEELPFQMMLQRMMLGVGVGRRVFEVVPVFVRLISRVEVGLRVWGVCVGEREMGVRRMATSWSPSPTSPPSARKI